MTEQHVMPVERHRYRVMLGDGTVADFVDVSSDSSRRAAWLAVLGRDGSGGANGPIVAVVDLGVHDRLSGDGELDFDAPTRTLNTKGTP